MAAHFRHARVVLALVLVAGCGATPLPPSGPVDTGPPASMGLPAGPPVMVLQAPDARGSAGDLGTFSWDGFASDSGWVVGRASLRLSAGDEIVGRIPAATPVRGWRTQWAAVRNETAGDPVAAGTGAGREVVVRPPAPGSWSLRLEVDFGEVGRASWYWRVEVEP